MRSDWLAGLKSVMKSSAVAGRSRTYEAQVQRKRVVEPIQTGEATKAESAALFGLFEAPHPQPCPTAAVAFCKMRLFSGAALSIRFPIASKSKAGSYPNSESLNPLCPRIDP